MQAIKDDLIVHDYEDTDDLYSTGYVPPPDTGEVHLHGGRV